MWTDKNLIEILNQGGIVVMPTDTIYGIVGRADSSETVGRIYKTRKRNPERPCIVLIGKLNDLEKFSIELTEEQKEKIKEYWPGPVSVILNCVDDKFEYLHRGTKTLAFRLPATEELREFLMKTGPLIAPSANPEGEPVAKNTNEARKYFENNVDFYVDGGQIEGRASKLIQLHKDGSVSILRE